MNVWGYDVSNLPWTWLAIRASGITAWGLLTAVILWGILLRTRVLGRFAAPMKLLDLHRWIGAIALTFLVAHLGLLLVDPSIHFTFAQLLIPGIAPWEPVAVAFGTLALWAMIPVSVLGRMKVRLGRVGNAWFKRAHYVAYAAWPLATAHYVLAGTDALSSWSIALLIAGTALLILGLVARGIAPAVAPHRVDVSADAQTDSSELVAHRSGAR